MPVAQSQTAIAQLQAQETLMQSYLVQLARIIGLLPPLSFLSLESSVLSAHESSNPLLTET